MRRIDISALAERVLAAQHQKSAAPLADEIGNHAQLIERKEAGLHAPKDHCLVLEKLRLISRETFFQSRGRLNPLAQKLAVRLTQQCDQLEIFIREIARRRKPYSQRGSPST